MKYITISYAFVSFDPSFAKASEGRRAFIPELAEGSGRTVLKTKRKIFLFPFVVSRRRQGYVGFLPAL
jgi:hypothetical protein